MSRRGSGPIVSGIVFCLVSPGFGQEPTQPGADAATAYKLTVIESASTSKRVKKGRVSSQAVVRITDQNNLPVPGIAVSFTIPQLVGGGGAAFANGALTTVVTT